MNDDRISVIIPIYNVKKYLDRCLKSVTKQTYSKLEIYWMMVLQMEALKYVMLGKKEIAELGLCTKIMKVWDPQEMQA